MQSPLMAAGLFVAASVGAGVWFTDNNVIKHGLTSAAFAQETAPAALLDLSALVRIGERDLNVTFSEDLDLTPISGATVTKIGYGRVEQVNVAWTASGTYSTDALASPNVLYPGVTVSPAEGEGYDSAGLNGARTHLRIGPGYVDVPGLPSFVVLTRSPGGAKITLMDGLTCVETGSSLICI
ncbi:MAG: hypothetical protein GXP01_00635 [Alphaproteobacteria bacterium]|nr:hypothetical protein [Alphaproteobacteria bacterium]